MSTYAEIGICILPVMLYAIETIADNNKIKSIRREPEMQILERNQGTD